jgi:hypothetical protein
MILWRENISTWWKPAQCHFVPHAPLYGLAWDWTRVSAVECNPLTFFFLFSSCFFNPFYNFKFFPPSSCHLCSLLLSLHNKHNTKMHAPGGIQTHNPSKRTAADPRWRAIGIGQSHFTAWVTVKTRVEKHTDNRQCCTFLTGNEMSWNYLVNTANTKSHRDSFSGSCVFTRKQTDRQARQT